MTDYYSSSPLPTPAPGTLPYPWITQFDPIYQVTFYVNLETQESTWTLPDLSNASYDPPAPAVDGTRSAPDGMYGGGVSDFNYSSASFPSSSTGGPNTASSGEASSFYASSGTIPQAPGQSTYTDQTPPQSYDANGQPIQGDGERGLGKIIVGGGAMYLAYKLYKDYQKGKLNQQQFKPPNPSDQTPQLHPPHGNYQYVHYPQDHFRPPQRDNNVAPMPNWNQKPTPSGYNGPPPGPYNAGGSSQVRASHSVKHM